MLTTNTCSGCLDDFVGDGGDQNTWCLNLAAVSTNGITCVANTDCGVWAICNASSVCAKVVKTCPHDCNADASHGECGWVDTNTNVSVTECFIGDVDCDPLYRNHA